MLLIGWCGSQYELGGYCLHDMYEEVLLARCQDFVTHQIKKIFSQKQDQI